MEFTLRWIILATLVTDPLICDLLTSALVVIYSLTHILVEDLEKGKHIGQKCCIGGIIQEGQTNLFPPCSNPMLEVPQLRIFFLTLKVVLKNFLLKYQKHRKCFYLPLVFTECFIMNDSKAKKECEEEGLLNAKGPFLS